MQLTRTEIDDKRGARLMQLEVDEVLWQNFRIFFHVAP